MPIDPVRALASQLPAATVSWTPGDIILYHLGVGAGIGRATDPAELEYTYEANLKVLPSFGVIPVFDALLNVNAIDGIDINFALVLHGEQDIVVHRPIPVHGQIESSVRVAGVYDKGKAGLILLEVESRDAGGPLFTNRFSVFARGEGGFGGEPGPRPEHGRPDRAPDQLVESPTLEHQALLYRLSGDKNPLHADPNMAAYAGFERPILHGLCTYGAVCKAVVDARLDGDVTRVARYQVRFSGVVYPGETIVTELWDEGDRFVIAAKTAERGDPVISNAALWLRSPERDN
jgi:acyl dehydratase